MKIALLGYGKMGKMVETLAPSRKHFIVPFDQAEMCIEFTHPDAVLKNISEAASQGKSLVVGTTGWFHNLEEAHKIVEKYQVGMLYSPNFSIGMALFSKIVKETAQLMRAFTNYDVSAIEYHHKHKVDSPSGTAKHLEKILHESLNREVPFTAIRSGNYPGTHTIQFDSLADTITLTHEARNREGFALGSIIAAEWLQGKRGVFTLNDMLEEVICKN